jgi:ketosteroid isomerase-like protein
MLTIASCCFLLLSSNGYTQGSDAAPYIAGFSSQFEMGDPKYTNSVLTLLKDFEENQTDRHSNLFADTLTFITPEGFVLKGKDQFLPGNKQYRGSFTNVKTSIEMYVSVKSVDRHRPEVVVRGSQEKIAKDGAKNIVDFQSVWAFNQDGKVTYVREYTSRHPQKP